MGNVQMEAEQIRYKDSSGTYRNVQTGLAAAIAGGGGGSSTLAGLSDTTITTPSDGQVLTYDGTAEKWENAAIPAQSIDGLSDTTITTPSDGQVLTYDSTAEKWENASIPAQSIDGLSDTTITTPSDGQVLTYDGTAEKWVNASGGSGGGGEVYSTTETKIGTWKGLDLYRRVYEVTLTGSTEQTIETLNDAYYITRLTAMRITLVGGSNFVYHPLPEYTYANNAFQSLEVRANKTMDGLNVIAANSTGTSPNLVVVIEYTKTTPAP